MINLCNRTEYSFRIAYGHLNKVLDANPDAYAGICDRNSTWGHVAFEKECKKRGKKAILGVELGVVDNAKIEEKQGASFVRFIATDNDQLNKLYRLVTRATAQFYYHPRIDRADIEELAKDIAILTPRPLKLDGCKNVFLDLNPTTLPEAVSWAIENSIPPIASCDNYYPRLEDETPYSLCMGRNAESKISPMVILDEWAWRLNVPGDVVFKDMALANAKTLAESSTTSLPKAKLVHPKVTKTMREMCEESAASRGVDLFDPIYSNRLKRELDLIKDKDYEDYFFLIADMVQFAKKQMLVGPARGSSCGSLVCYLLYITDIDPIPYDLLFERFIDINRKDLPDIDIDFPEDKRDIVFEYLRNTYGSECVAQLGTISRYRGKNTIVDVAKELNIPSWETNDIKEAIFERLDGDARANFCIADTFKDLEIGQKFIQKFPEMVVAGEIEAHARNSGRHAAGIVVTADPVFNYCSVDVNTGSTQVDKYDAEELNLLKIDALGLRTLTLIQDCLDQVGMSRGQLLDWRLDDSKAFEILNDKKFTGIFQFEGYALQGITHQFNVDNFEDIVAITALARPGPMISGMTNEWIKRRVDGSSIVPEHPIVDEVLKTSLGVVVYQEQIMKIAREVGLMTWEDVSSLRKAMSKSLGKEYFDKYKKQFMEGANKNGFTNAEKYWDRTIAFGAWSFNRSHAVAYGMVSYWCLVLKAYYPLQYAAACLRHSKDEEQQIRLLRELNAEGYKYKAFDKDLSEENWSVKDGIIIGGLMGVKGVGEKTAKDICKRRAEGTPLTPAQAKKLETAVTPYDTIFECKERWGHIIADPLSHGIATRLTEIKDITIDSNGLFCIIAKLSEKKLRDKNDAFEIKKRDGKLADGQTLFLDLKLEDDTDTLKAGINASEYMRIGKAIYEEGKIGDWYVFKGKVRSPYRKMYIDRVKKLS